MFRQGNKIKISDTLYRKIRLAAEIRGCPVEDFIENALQKEAERTITLSRRPDDIPSEIEETAANQ
jgi:hypothetical protein